MRTRMAVVAVEAEGASRQAQTIPAGCTSGPIREIRSVIHPVPITDPNISSVFAITRLGRAYHSLSIFDSAVYCSEDDFLPRKA